MTAVITDAFLASYARVDAGDFLDVTGGVVLACSMPVDRRYVELTAVVLTSFGGESAKRPVDVEVTDPSGRRRVIYRGTLRGYRFYTLPVRFTAREYGVHAIGVTIGHADISVPLDIREAEPVIRPKWIRSLWSRLRP